MNIETLIDANRRNKLPVEPTDWFYKNMVPKELEANLAYRKKMLEIGYSNEELAYEIRCICARDILFEINTFGWTYSPKDHPENPIRPFITYAEYQDEAILKLRDRIGKGDVGVPKSRDMGASWISLLVMEHRWRYLPNQSFLLASRKEEYVDGKQGDMDALLPKIEWYTQHLPLFLRPKSVGRTKNNILNNDNRSRFTGEATVENLGTGGRRTAIFLDEVSKMPSADDIFTSTRDVTKCRIFNSTPNGRFGIGEPFYKKIANPDTEKIFLHWSDHPLKRTGLYYLDENKNKKTFEEGWSWKNEYDFGLLSFTGRQPRSEWYDEQVKREDHNLRKIAQECDINFIGSGMSVIPAEMLSRWIQRMATPATTWGMTLVDPDSLSLTWMASEGPVEDAPFRLWLELKDGRPPVGEYIIGADIGRGTGGSKTSNSALEIVERRSRKIVGSFAKNTIRPVEFAKLAAAIGKWFYDAMIVPEANGPGGEFIEELRQVGYWNVYRQRVKAIGYDKETEKIGYANSDRGTALLESMFDAISCGKFTVPDEAVIREFGQYIVDDDGKFYHAGAKDRDSVGEMNQAHGDRAIAAGCAYLGLKSMGEPDPEKAAPEKIPRNCPAARFAAADARRKRQGEWGYKW